MGLKRAVTMYTRKLLQISFHFVTHSLRLKVMRACSLNEMKTRKEPELRRVSGLSTQMH